MRLRVASILVPDELFRLLELFMLGADGEDVVCVTRKLPVVLSLSSANRVLLVVPTETVTGNHRQKKAAPEVQQAVQIFVRGPRAHS